MKVRCSQKGLMKIRGRVYEDNKPLYRIYYSTLFFTGISLFHIRLSCTRSNRSCPLHPHQSLMSSSHSLQRRPPRGFPSIFANIVRFITLLSFILHMCLNTIYIGYSLFLCYISPTLIGCSIRIFVRFIRITFYQNNFRMLC